MDRTKRKHRMDRRIVAAAALLLLPAAAGCGSKVRATPFPPGGHAPVAADVPVQMFSTRTPDCAYREVGLLRAEPRSGLTPWQRVVDAFLARARQMGGDGVILRHGLEIRATEEGSVVRDDVLSGTVIRFESAECRR